jgi:UDP-glucose 4-epimerase
MARLIVTGGMGFIGSHLVKQLKKLGHMAYVMDINYKPEPINLTSYVDTKRHLEELTDHKTKPLDVLFDLTTLPLPRSLVEPYHTVYQIYCMGTVICELSREGYFKTLIHCSSSEIYDITTPYAAAKDAQDKLIKSYVNCFGIDARIVRPFNTYGEGQDLGALIPNTIKRILKGQQPIIYGDGNNSRDYVYVDDTVKGIISMWESGKKGENLDITSQYCYSNKEIVEKIIKLMKYNKQPEYLTKRRGDTIRIHGQNTVPYTPKVSLEEGLKRTIKWWRKQNFTL